MRWPSKTVPTTPPVSWKHSFKPTRDEALRVLHISSIDRIDATDLSQSLEAWSSARRGMPGRFSGPEQTGPDGSRIYAPAHQLWLRTPVGWVSDPLGPVVREPVDEFNPGFGTRDDTPRLPLQLDLDQLPERAARDERASWTVTMTTRFSSSK